MRYRVLVAVLLLSVTLLAAMKSSDIAGTWKFVPGKSTGGYNFPPDTTLVVKQYGARTYFEYWANDHLFRRDDYATDGRSEKLYSTANETAVIAAKWRKNELQIVTQHVMENEIGSQSFSETDRWILGDQGKSLTAKTSDGKVVVFERQSNSTARPATSSDKPAASPPAAK